MWFKGKRTDVSDTLEEGAPEAQGKRKFLNSRSIIMFIILMVLTGFAVARYLPDSSRYYKSLESRAVPKYSAAVQNSVAIPPLPADKAQQTGQTAKADNTALNVQTNRAVYIPARDILSGNNAALLQDQEEKNKLLEAEVKEKKLLSELKKVSGEIEIIPYQVTAQKKEISAKIEEKKNLQPVMMSDKEAAPPTLVSIRNMGGNTVASFILATGEHIDARVGETAGDFTVRQIDHNQALLEDKKGKKLRAVMKLPERYPVSASMFAAKPPAGSVAQPAVQQTMPYAPGQPVQVPISPVGVK
ncbi:MAG: type IV pilus biogenesis protein PilP [Nitrospirae bacterium]|nr:type IV pilus biogenesis protein PilP [Nitrospirota bacterium]